MSKVSNFLLRKYISQIPQEGVEDVVIIVEYEKDFKVLTTHETDKQAAESINAALRLYAPKDVTFEPDF